MATVTPPIKCQGIKTKILPLIRESIPQTLDGTWIEPFCGSCVVALNICPERALLADTNIHIISLYRQIQEGVIDPLTVREFLEQESRRLSREGEPYYYEVRSRFNQDHHPLDFLFLNRSCFNGVMRFNQKGIFNVPFCHKPDRFSPAYITKIVNQVKNLREVMKGREWQFEVLDFQHTLARAQANDFVYADPPYAGRHVDYFNSWSAENERHLISALQKLPCRFILSTWHSNEYRENQAIQSNWQGPSFFTRTCEHFYHVGSTEALRNAMTEALIANYDMLAVKPSQPLTATFAKS